LFSYVRRRILPLSTAVVAAFFMFGGVGIGSARTPIASAQCYGCMGTGYGLNNSYTGGFGINGSYGNSSYGMSPLRLIR
jgi:hypothetical protein